METRKVGRICRAARLHQHLRQQDVADRAGVSRSTVSALENGPLEDVSLAVIRRITDILDVRLEVTAFYRGQLGERLINRRHSLLADSVAAALRRYAGWHMEPEVSFSFYGERGVIDQLAWHAATRHLLVIELKTEFVDFNELLGTLDRKVRLARQVARERGWKPAMVSVWLIVSDRQANRRAARSHAALLASRFELDGRSLAAFLRNPARATSGLAFWSIVGHSDATANAGANRTRVRRPAQPPEPEPEHPGLNVKPGPHEKGRRKGERDVVDGSEELHGGRAFAVEPAWPTSDRVAGRRGT